MLNKTNDDQPVCVYYYRRLVIAFSNYNMQNIKLHVKVRGTHETLWHTVQLCTEQKQVQKGKRKGRNGI
jgi:hypothetical protein